MCPYTLSRDDFVASRRSGASILSDPATFLFFEPASPSPAPVPPFPTLSPPGPRTRTRSSSSSAVSPDSAPFFPRVRAAAVPPVVRCCLPGETQGGPRRGSWHNYGFYRSRPFPMFPAPFVTHRGRSRVPGCDFPSEALFTLAPASRLISRRIRLVESRPGLGATPESPERGALNRNLYLNA